MAPKIKHDTMYIIGDRSSVMMMAVNAQNKWTEKVLIIFSYVNGGLYQEHIVPLDALQKTFDNKDQLNTFCFEVLPNHGLDITQKPEDFPLEIGDTAWLHLAEENRQQLIEFAKTHPTTKITFHNN